MNKFFLWTLTWFPRILAILFILFVSLFALDVFKEGLTVLETLTALFMHLIPTMLLLIALVIAWKWAWSGFLFFLLAVFFIFLTKGNAILTTLIFSGVPVLIGTLFIAGWWYRIIPHSGC
jgi:hypothetical protein